MVIIITDEYFYYINYMYAAACCINNSTVKNNRKSNIINFIKCGSLKHLHVNDIFTLRSYFVSKLISTEYAIILLGSFNT